MGFVEEYMMKINCHRETTVLKGEGEFLDFESNETYKINAIMLPFTANGKHITVFSKEEGLESFTEWRSFFDGKILSFTCKNVDHWGEDEK